MVIQQKSLGLSRWANKDGRNMGFEGFIEACDDLFAEMASLADPVLLGRVTNARDRLRKERLNILVVGEFSRGKSTFINALVGEPVLPSKVNPTTAAISVLSGGTPRSGRIEYQDGSYKELHLPTEQVNKYLNQFVTTTNTEVNRIRTVRLQVEGRIERLRVDIIDTPGVNDLDQAREEITFSYLRNADAAVLLLDAQQPLSDSERTFLTEKVFGNDVHRVLFVVNKIDEVLTSGSLEDIPRIIAYVRKRLQDMLGLADPRVFAVSAKNALRARYKGEIDQGPTSFEDFESELISFAAEQAHEGRLRTHIERLNVLIGEQKQLLQAESTALKTELGDVGRALHEVEERRLQLERARVQVESRAKRDAQRLGEVISRVASGEIENLKRAITADIVACSDEDDMVRLRASLSLRLRSLANTVETTAATERENSLSAIEADFGEYLACAQARPPVAHHIEVPPVDLRRPARAAGAQDSSNFNLQETVAGFGLGYVGASLFGPIGIAAAVVGSYFMSKSNKEKQTAEIAKQEREDMVRALDESCDQLTERARNLAAEVARNESETIERNVRNRLDRGINALSSAAEAMRRRREQTRAESESAIAEVSRRLDLISVLQMKVGLFEERAYAAIF
jgi:GTPase Era involved in 16S rRNA processing